MPSLLSSERSVYMAPPSNTICPKSNAVGVCNQAALSSRIISFTSDDYKALLDEEQSACIKVIASNKFLPGLC